MPLNYIVFVILIFTVLF